MRPGQRAHAPKIFTVPRCTPSLLAKVISRYFNWMVIGTSTVSPVTFTKSGAHVERHQVGDDLGIDDFFQILELDRRRRLQLGKLLQAVELLGCLVWSSSGRFPVAPNHLQ